MCKAIPKISLLVGLLFFVSSCANYKLHLSDAAKSKAEEQPDPQLKISHTVYLIGDAGLAGEDEKKSATTLLKTHLQSASENSSVFFLGDNIYPSGLPPKSEETKRKEREGHLDAQIDALKDYKGKAVFIPGNHDWDEYGLKGLHRQEKYIEKALNKGIEDEDDWDNYFLPDNGCPGPEVIKVNDKLVFLIVDSEWWMQDWKREPSINSGCELKSREEFAALVEDAIKKHKDKNILILSHHPFRSYGSHGGKYTLKNHIFPFTVVSKNFYLPLPIVGSLLMGIRNSGISKQDIANGHNKDFRKAIEKPAIAHGEYIFASGHEHNLQYIQDKGQHFIVSGAGSKKTAVAKGEDLLFGYGKAGFSKIDYYEDGSAWVEFWTPEEGKEKGKMVFRSRMKGPLAKPSDKGIPTSFPEYESNADSSLQFPITTPIRPKTKFEEKSLGIHHIDIYLEKFNFPTLDLASFEGGLSVIKKGGGKQTNSLRLVNPEGKEFVMRSLTKDLKAIPYPFNQLSLVKYLFQDNYLGTHPFAPLVIPTLADASKVYHANPNIYYVPKQPSLGLYNESFGGEVYIVEERASKDRSDLASFGNSKKFISTFDLAQKMEKNHKHRVDQNWVARSRLFDLLIGDFDRHDDQWRWAVIDDNGKYKTYRPIPRDRDQAFSKYDGYLINILSPYNALLRQLSDYEEDIDDFTWATYNTRHFDHNFLNELSYEEWQKEAAFIQQNLTDEVIDEAFSHFPTRVQEISSEKIINALKRRREQLPQIAEGLYRQLSKKIAIHGTEKEEYFEVIRRDDEHTEVNMYDSNKDGEKKERLYHRIVKTSETEEVLIYGLGDSDVFHVSGKASKGVIVRLVGGLGKDKFIDESHVNGISKKTKIYDKKTGNKLQLSSESRNLTSNNANLNSYNRLGNQYDENSFLPLPIIGFNGDDGVLVGFMGAFVKHGFNKSPYSQLHTIGGNYAFATKGLNLSYSGEYIEAVGSLDFVTNLELRNNRYALNFFGIGNDTERPVDNRDYYRVRQSMLYVDMGLQKRFASDVGRFSILPALFTPKIERVGNRFIDIDDHGLEPEDFERRLYGQITANVNFSSVDNRIFTRNGFHFNNYIGHTINLTGSKRQFTTFGSNLTIYKPVGNLKNMVFASRIGAEFIRGNYDFFFAPSLGQKENIRGLFRERYRGESTFFHTTDLRIGLGNVKNNVLPFTFGITGSFDYGRVWVDGEDSETWHNSYGGGIWLMPLNLAVVSITYNKSNASGLLLVTVGHAF